MLPVPSHWRVSSGAGHTTYDVTGDGACLLKVTELGALPESATVWMQHQIRDGRPAGAQITVLHAAEVETVDGWPARSTEVVIAGPPAEARLIVLYTFFEHGAAAIVRCPDLDRFASVREEIAAVLRQARPAWSDQDRVCLQRLLEPVSS